MATRVVRLTIITDFACVNCCVGHHELLNAIAYCKDILQLPLAFQLEHLPFRLINTSVLTEDSPKVDKSDFLQKQLGKERFSKLEAGISKWAEEKGIPISFRGVMSQSTRAHRLCQKAYKIGGQNLQTPLLCAIFKAYMEEGQDVADIQVLAGLAEGTGTMSSAEAIKFLESDELVSEVNAMCNEARSKGITGVPMTIIDGKWAVSGGQSSDVFVQIFKKLATPGVHNAPSPFSSPVADTVLVA
ncbi:thioredoxin-like protein [Gymnopilus junonius]|uniref:Thioredoxin-like protein n=1 Tax=Gymnopilus junonius TaxID=109634 RepID=A0A9P5TMQ4_GYMJU|nr:thioredoxin-like protein [Gymnopilus junonius]